MSDHMHEAEKWLHNAQEAEEQLEHEWVATYSALALTHAVLAVAETLQWLGRP